MGWHDERFVPHQKRFYRACECCRVGMWFPKTKVSLYKTCSDACRDSLKQFVLAGRKKFCETCGKTFLPRPGQIARGQGRFCSQACNTAVQLAARTEAAQAKRMASLVLAISEGRRKTPTGPKNSRWLGGITAARARGMSKKVVQTRQYRAANPLKVRDWRKVREGKKTTRLPRGTVKRIGDLQRWACPICRCGIRKDFHVDHVVPLAKGGKHHPLNLQLLCPSCNVKKSAKDPVAYMQERGFLL